MYKYYVVFVLIIQHQLKKIKYINEFDHKMNFMLSFLV